MTNRRSRLLTTIGYTLLTAFVVVGTSVAYTLRKEEGGPAVLTTNIDIKHQHIRDTGPDEVAAVSWREKAAHDLAQFAETIAARTASVVNLASPSIKYIQITQGLRKEQIASIVGDELDWSDTERQHFIDAKPQLDVGGREGYFYPGTYILSASDNSQSVAALMNTRFNQEVVARYGTSTRNIVNIDTALKIASLIEREAAGKSDRRLVSGVIWNRIFEGMSLDIDATLQYAKGTEANGWWPRVYPQDKYLDSPFNTYKNKGLPPTPISNPSLLAIQAALNPAKTPCLFYLHDQNHGFHCSTTYQGQVANVQRYYGN